MQARSRTGTDRRLDLLAPMGIRLAAMLAQLAVLLIMDASNRVPLYDLLNKWDGHFYVGIATHGYPSSIVVNAGNLTSGNAFAFFPLLPLLTRAVSTVTFLPEQAAVLVVSWAATLVTAVVIHLLALELTGSRRLGYISVALLGALPMSIAFEMGYAESLYVLMVAMALLLVVRGNLLGAALFMLLAGLTRPTGLVLAVLIPVAALSAARHNGGGLRRHLDRVPEVVGCTVLAALGAPLYWLFVWARSGVVDGWQRVESVGWGTTTDYGASAWEFLRQNLEHLSGLVAIVTTGVLCGYLVMVVTTLVQRWPAVIPVSVVAPMALVLGSTNYWHSRPRLLLAAFTIVLPAAKLLYRLPDRVLIPLLVLLSGASFWFGAYMLTVWPYAI